MFRRWLTAFAVGLVGHGAIRLFLSLTFVALIFYHVVSPEFLMSPLVADWGTLIVLSLATLPSGFFVGYFSREWGWILSALLAPAWSVCAFPLTPILQTWYVDVFDIGSNLGEYYMDWALVAQQVLPGMGLGLLSGVLGEYVVLRLANGEIPAEEHIEGSEAADEEQAWSLGGVVWWYFPKSVLMALRTPILLLFGGLALYVIVSNAGLLLGGLLGGTVLDQESGETVSLAPMATVIVIQAVFALSPALIVPYLWWPSVRLPRSSRVGLSTAGLLLWFAAFVVLSSLGLM